MIYRITSAESALQAVANGSITKIAGQEAIRNLELGYRVVDIAGPSLAKCDRCEEFKPERNWDGLYGCCEDCANEMSLG